jgi:DNA-directed RNA polymerase subunit RPC12/RpoP
MSTYRAYTRYHCLECGQEHSFRLTLQEDVTVYFHGPYTDSKTDGKSLYSCEEVDRGHGGDFISKVVCSICGATGDKIQAINEG